MIDFEIGNNGEVSQQFIELGYTRFSQAAQFIKYLPYRRNTDKKDKLAVLKENCGTCSTKHSLLAELAIENQQPAIELRLGVFKMGENYSKPVGEVLKKYNLPYMPEAHNYLAYNGERYDYTNSESSKADFENELIIEEVITPQQITDYKVAFHKKVLQQWIAEKNLPYTLAEVWSIREECIAALSVN